MKHQNEPDELWSELAADMSGAQFQAEAFAGTMTAARRRQLRRRGLVCLSVVLPVMAAALFLLKDAGEKQSPGNQSNAASSPRHGTTQNAAVKPTASRTIPGTSIEVISDEELLALFNGRSVGLIGKSGRQQLVFLDEGTEP